MASAKSTPATDDDLLTVKEAATMLGVSRSKLYHTKDFPFVVMVGSSRRYSHNGIQKYIHQSQRKA